MTRNEDEEDQDRAQRSGWRRSKKRKYETREKRGGKKGVEIEALGLGEGWERGKQRRKMNKKDEEGEEKNRKEKGLWGWRRRGGGTEGRRRRKRQNSSFLGWANPCFR